MPCLPKQANTNRRLRPHLGQIAACGYYSFAKERVARSHPLAPALAVKLAEQRLADGEAAPVCQPFCPLRSKGIQSPAAAVCSLRSRPFSSLAGPAFEQVRLLADFHQPVLFIVGQFAVIDLVLPAEQHHQFFNLASLDLQNFP